MSVNDADSAERRGLMYKVLARGFSYPTETLVSYLKKKDYWIGLCDLLEFIETNDQSQLSLLLQNAADAIEKECRILGLTGFEVEYNRLFQLSSVSPCPLTASEYLPGESRQALAVAQLRGLYKSFGLRVKVGSEADSLSVMLEFMAWLCAKQARAANAESQDHVKICMRAQQIMLEDYLGWVPMLTDNVERNSDYAYYRCMAVCLRGYLQLERQTILTSI